METAKELSTMNKGTVAAKPTYLGEGTKKTLLQEKASLQEESTSLLESSKGYRGGLHTVFRTLAFPRGSKCQQSA